MNETDLNRLKEKNESDNQRHLGKCLFRNGLGNYQEITCDSNQQVWFY